MSEAESDAHLELSRSRAKAYLHVAKSLVMNEFGPASEHTHTEATIALASAMMQHEGAQIIADAFRVSSGLMARTSSNL